MTHSRFQRVLAAYGSVGILALSLLAIAGFGTWAVLSGASARQDICEAVSDERDALRRVLTLARDSSLANAASKQELRRSQRFWRRLLTEVPPLNCRSGTPVESELP